MDATMRPVHDGYVRLVDVMGSDLTVANAARTSFEKESAALSDADRRLIRYLARHSHLSPFRHCVISFEVRAPLMVARQWFKYVVGSDHTMDAWNEASRRYVSSNVEFYLPKADAWRGQPANKKQGSEGRAPNGEFWTTRLEEYQARGAALYETAMEDGICTEQARLFLAAYGLYVRWRWTASLQSVAFFLAQRLDDAAQVEIQEYAAAVEELATPCFPESLPLLVATLRQEANS